MDQLDQQAAQSRVNALTLEPLEAAQLIVGEPGLGKSYLLDCIAQASPMRHALVRGRPEEADFDLSGFSNLFDTIRGEHGAGFGRHLVLKSASPERLFAAAQDVAEVLQGLRLEPTLALIDDLDQMDQLSQSLIGILAGRLVGTNVRLVATATSVRPDAPLASIPSIVLKPMSLQQTLDIADSIAPEADPSTMRIIAGYVRGNPLVLTEQLSRNDPYQIAGIDWLTLPLRSTKAVRAIAAPVLAGLDPRALSMMEAVALAPSAHRDALIASDPAADDMLDDLVDLALLRSHGPYVSVSDPRIRMQLHWSLDARTRRERKLELAALTEPHDPDLAIWYRSHGALSGAMIDKLLGAATSLVTQKRVDEAVELTELALSRAHSIQSHIPALIDLCSKLLLAGEIDLTERYSNRVRSSVASPDEHMALATLRLSAHVLSARQIADEEAQALVHLHAADDRDAAANLLTLAAIHRAERWEVDEARAIFAPAQELGDAVSEETQRKLGAVMTMLDALEGVPPADGQVESTDPSTAGQPPYLLLLRGRTQTWRENYSAARRSFTFVKNHPEAEDPVWTQLANFAIVGNEISAGEFHLARQAIDVWESSTTSIGRATSSHTLVRAWCDYAHGRFDTALDRIDLALFQASREASQGARARALALRGTICLLMNDHESVVSDLRQVSTMSTRFRNPGLLRHWPDYVEACLYTGRTQEAQATHRMLERRLTDHTTRWGFLVHARLAGMVGPDDSVVERFTHATKLFGPQDSSHELGRTLLAYADRLATIGLATESRRVRASALTSFQRSGSDIWSARAQKPPVIATPTNALDRLTPEERDIAQRVCDGQRNREIALSLHLSIRTIELRLTRIYRTLNVHSRAELVSVVNEIRFPNSRS